MAPSTRALLNYRTGGYIGMETKFIDHEYGSTTVNFVIPTSLTDPAVGSLSAISQGDGESNRDGRKVTLKSIHINGNVTRTSGTNSSRVRLLLVHDSQTNGSALSPEDVLLIPTSATALATYAFRNLQHTSRFKVLYDKTFTLTPSLGFDGVSAVSNTPEVNFKINKKLNMPVTYKDTSADVANITDNSLHLMCVTDSTGVVLQYNVRTRFVG